MTRLVIRYQTKPEATQHNTELIENVFREAAAAAPKGVQYCVLRTDDGTFFHFVAYENEEANEGLTGLPAFEAFLAGGEARRLGAPDRREVTVVGNYRLLTE